MNIVKITYTGSEALEMTKSTFPNDWENKISDGIESIKGYMRMYRCDAMTAYPKFLNSGARPDNQITTLAALFLMNKNMEVGSEIKRLLNEQQQCGMQSAALSEIKSMSHEEKNELRGFYAKKQTQNETRINELLKSFEVISPQHVIHQPKLFGATG